MLFNSYEFLFLFLPTAVFGFFLIARYSKYELALFYLVLMSLFFYGWWNPIYLLLLATSLIVNYLFGRVLTREGAKSNQKPIMLLAVLFNLGLLGYFKYANFFVDTANSIVNTHFTLEKIVLPLAISFFTFQQITYIVDAYRGLSKEYSFLHYCLFVTFFPQLLAGPIVHHKEMLPQFQQPDTMRFNINNIAIGSAFLVLGLFKKVIMADNLAIFSQPAFTTAEQGGIVYFLDGWLATTAFTLGVYFDFSAYSDMAMGIARMFGIALPINFLSPMKAKNMIELWQRWHITLTRFLRNYIFKTLGGASHGQFRRHSNTMITMLLGGLWHGASWTFVIWGGLNGAFLVINHLWQSLCKRWGIRPSKYRLWRGLSWFITFHSFVGAAVFFKAESMASAKLMLAGMFGLNGFDTINGIYQSLIEATSLADLSVFLIPSIFYVVTAIAVLMMPNVYQVMAIAMTNNKLYARRQYRYEGRIPSWKPNGRWAIFLALVALFVLSAMSTKVSEFVYFQF